MSPRVSGARPVSKLAVVLAISLAGQPTPIAAQLHAGLQSGITVSGFEGGLAEGADPVLGGTFAIDLEYWLGPRWVLDVDVGLVQRGAGNLTIRGDTVDYRINYLEVPVMLGHAFPISGGRWHLAPYIGAALSRVSDCGVRFEGEWRYGDCGDQTPGGRSTRFDVSVPLGVAVRHRYPGGSRLSFELRYSESLSNVLSSDGASARNRLLQALIGFVLPLREVER